MPGALLVFAIGRAARFGKGRESDDGGGTTTMAVARRAGPAWLPGGHQRDQAAIREADPGGKNRATHDHTPAVDQHDVSGLAESNRLGRGGEKLLGVDDAMQDPDRLVPEAVHDRKRDRKCVSAGPVVVVHILDIELPDALIEGALPPRRLPMREG